VAGSELLAGAAAGRWAVEVVAVEPPVPAVAEAVAPTSFPPGGTQSVSTTGTPLIEISYRHGHRRAR